MDPSDPGFRTPGQLIDALLRDRGWTQRVLAIVLDLDETGINRLVADKRPVNAPLALALEELFGVAAHRFLELQQSFDLAKARITSRPNAGRVARAHLFGGLPVAEMIKRGWIATSDIRDVSKVEENLARFFGANSVSEIEILPHAAKKTIVNTDPSAAQLAWLYRVRHIAAEMLVPRYSPEKGRAVVEELRSLLAAPEEARKVPRILAEAGIRFVIAETLASAKIDGVCFWLDDVSPVIGLSMRYDRIDNFWFVLRHEVEHVLCRHGKGGAMLDTELEGERAGVGGNIAEEERVANSAAADFCVPPKMLDAFIVRKSPLFSERDLLGFSKTIHVHPGLVAGQLQFRTKRYELFRDHLVKMRSIVRPSAIADGWGDIVPVDY